MADDLTMTEPDAAAALRPCAYCGTPVHPASHRCLHCGGHVGLAWGTVHREIFLFLFLAIATVVGCLASWTGRTPVVEVTRTLTPAPAVPGAAPGAPKPAPIEEVKTHVTQAVTHVGGPRNGLDTLRGVFLLAVALYGVIAGILNALYRRLVMWPAVVGGFVALWIGLQGVVNAMGSDAWGHWATWAQGKSLLETKIGALRTIAPGFMILAFVGLVTVFKLLAGILAAASKGKEEAAAAKETGAARRRGKRGDAGADGDAAPSEGASPPPLP
jgi:hypothetical protein